MPAGYDPSVPARLIIGYPGTDWIGEKIQPYLALEGDGLPNEIFAYPDRLWREFAGWARTDAGPRGDGLHRHRRAYGDQQLCCRHDDRVAAQGLIAVVEAAGDAVVAHSVRLHVPAEVALPPVLTGADRGAVRPGLALTVDAGVGVPAVDDHLAALAAKPGRSTGPGLNRRGALAEMRV